MILTYTECTIKYIPVACCLTSSAIFFILFTDLFCLLPRFLKKETERIEVPLLTSIVQCEFVGLEHFDPVHGLLPFELRQKLSLRVVKHNCREYPFKARY